MDFMKTAIEEACAGVQKGDGGPFGAIVVKDGQIVASGHNMVICKNDPTAHAEITAIRNACAKVENFNLAGCVLYTSCYPCPMCMGAVLWAGIKEIYYAASSEDAESVGFGDKIYHEFVQNPPNHTELCQLKQVPMENKFVPFQKWSEKEDRVPY